jgi:toxin ParE1/3/4
MTGRYTLAPRAQGDLDEIWNYTVGRWDIGQAEFYVRQIGRDIETVAAQPAMGRACPDIRSGYYKYPTGSHVLFYRLIAGGIDVVRILHERMDFGRHI